jgi:hypothetical protein
MATSPLTRKRERRGDFADHRQRAGGDRRVFWPAALVDAASLRLYRRPRKVRRTSAQSERDVLENGAIAQLGERFNGIEEVVGSIPSGSTILTIRNR